jgi:hypothetical protein
MSKRILIVTSLFLALFVLIYNIQNYFLNEVLSFSLLNVCLFHLIAAIIVYASVELVANKLPNQAGYAYLTLIFIKIGAFVLIFQSSVFANDNLTQVERLVLVVPLFVFLITEAICVSRLLNNQ